jgi:hypothetical protein
VKLAENIFFINHHLNLPNLISIEKRKIRMDDLTQIISTAAGAALSPSPAG